MKKALVVVAALALTAPLYAGGVNIFVTSSADPYGLTIPGNAFNPTGGAHDFDSPYYRADYSDYPPTEYAVTASDPTGLIGTIPSIDPGAGEFGYIWFNITDMPAGAKLQGLHLGWGEAADLAYYIGDDSDGWSAFAGSKRWDGAYTMPGEPEFKMNPQVLAAVTAYGIKNAANPTDVLNLQTYAAMTDPPPPPVAWSSTHLLGAIAFEDTGAERDVEGFLADLGISFSGGVQTDFVNIYGAHVLPEPASLLLLGLAGLLIRRR
jgi:hypothetical protein